MSWFETVRRTPWIFALAGSILLWLAMGMTTGNLSLESLLSNAVSAAFLAIPALGQMLVVTTGRGAIDLSIPGMITLSAFLTTGIANGQDGRLPLAMLAVAGAGLAVGLLNSLLVLLLRIPPIIATVAMGYILTTASLLYNEGFAAFSIAPTLTALIRNRIAGIPLMLLFIAAIAFLAHGLIRLTPYGKSLSAVGQNIEAAYLAGIRTGRVQVAAYVMSSLLAGLAGILISARVGGAFLGMGDSFMLETVGAVVLGGTLIFGGRASAVGTLTGALFLVLVSTAMQVAGLPIGSQNIIKGVIIVAVLLLVRNPSE